MDSDSISKIRQEIMRLMGEICSICFTKNCSRFAGEPACVAGKLMGEVLAKGGVKSYVEAQKYLEERLKMLSEIHSGGIT